VTLGWTASSGAASYNVYRSTLAGNEGTTPIATGVTGTAWINTGLTNGTLYYYKVAAVNTGGTSGMSNEASATPKVPAPPAPTGLTATAGNAQVTLAWTASSGAASYNVYRSTVAGNEGTAPIATGVTATAWINTGLTNGTLYYYKVAAVNAGGTSGMSNEASATPKAPPSGPVNVTSSVSIRTTRFAYNRRTGTYNGTMTITNQTAKAIPGPLEAVLTNLPAGVTLFNLSGTTNGSPFITVPGVGSLGAGRSATVTLEFKNPSSGSITFTTTVYSGTL